jgi:thiol-disulfide isomerase/thioredoxin
MIHDRRSLAMMRLVVVLSLAATCLLAGCDQQPAGPVSSSGANGGPSSSSGSVEPIDVAGLNDKIDQAAANGDILVIDFWATWCPPCKAMFDDIHDLKEVMSGVDVITVSLDGDSEGGQSGAQKAGDYLRTKPYDAFEDAYIVAGREEQNAVVNALGENWNDIVAPAVFVFDREGQMAGEFIDMGPKETVHAVTRKVLDLKSSAKIGDDQPSAATRPEELPDKLDKNDSDAPATQPAGSDPSGSNDRSGGSDDLDLDLDL